MAVRRSDEGGEPDELSVAQEIGAEFASYEEEAYAPTDDQYPSLWQAQVSWLQAHREPPPLPEPAPVKELPPSRKKILLVEDDDYAAKDYEDSLRAHGFKVLHVRTADRALEVARQDRHFGAVVIDIRMHHGNFFGAWETVHGTKTGIHLAAELLNLIPDTIFVALTNSRAADDAEWFEGHGDFGFFVKGDMPPPRFARYLRRVIFKERPRAFIVHGHDLRALYELSDYLVNTLGFRKPLILKDERSGGKTVIEKLEYYEDEVDVVFALLTPDDLTVSPEGEPPGRRARQNVIYEVGWFHAIFGRKSGQVILLYKKGVELPSDLSGVIPIDISDGLSAADEEIRRELRPFLPPGTSRSLA
jgi:CheY-like chemotaxis protein